MKMAMRTLRDREKMIDLLLKEQKKNLRQQIEAFPYIEKLWKEVKKELRKIDYENKNVGN